MGIDRNKEAPGWRKTLKYKRKTGKDAGNGGVPIITDNDNDFSKKNVDKKTVHKYGLLHESVHIVIISGDGKKILLQQRGKAKKQWKEYWDIIGEHLVEGDHNPFIAAKNLFEVELRKNWSDGYPSFQFSIRGKLKYTGTDKNGKEITTIDNEIRHVYVIITDIDESAIEAMNKELNSIEQSKQETISFKWFDKKEFESKYLHNEIVPYNYWINCDKYDNFKSFMKKLKHFVTKMI